MAATADAHVDARILPSLGKAAGRFSRLWKNALGALVVAGPLLLGGCATPEMKGGKTTAFSHPRKFWLAQGGGGCYFRRDSSEP
jgi:hypothetical protein